MSEFNIEEQRKWYESQRPTYELFSNTVKNTLESLIKTANIDYLYVTARTKKIDSFIEKIGRKNYQNPNEEITDLVGVRVITFIESDALKVNDLIEKSFDVDDSKSLNKSDELGIDKFGYRSFHFICGLGSTRCSLPEFKLFKNLVCEIQVRTVLQHAWAEIEHDRNYKFNGILPKEIQRRLHLIAGILEIADGQFNNLSNEIDRYSEEVSRKTKEGDLDIELTTISLYQYLENLKKRINFNIELMTSKTALQKTIAELYLYNIYTIAGVDALFTNEFLDVVNNTKQPKVYSLPYLITDAMAYANIENYFQFVHTKNTIAFDVEIFDVFVGKYGSEKVHQLFKENGDVSVVNWETGEFTLGKMQGKRLNRP